MANTRKPIYPVYAIKQKGVRSTNGKQVYIYRALVDPTKYPPNLGDPISGKFETPSEIDKKPLKKVLFNQEKLEKNISDLALITVLNPGFLAEQGASLLAMIVEGQVPHGPGAMATMANVAIRDQYKKIIIQPRLGLTYPIHADMESTLFHDERAGSIVNVKLALNFFPDKMAETWIVADTSPGEVSRNGKLEKTGNEFVCFSKEDAEKVVASMQKNQFENLDIQKAAIINSDPGLNNIPDKIYKHILNDYLEVLHKWDKKFYPLINRQHEYERDMQQIAAKYSMNQGGDRTTIEKAHIANVDRGYSYDIGTQAETSLRRPGKIYIQCTDTGLAYEVIGKDNQIKSGEISWHSIPWFPKTDAGIIQYQEYLIGPLLTETFKQHVTSLVRYPHFEQIEQINYEIKHLIDYIQELKKENTEFTPELRKKIHNDMQYIASRLADYALTHPYAKTIAHNAFWEITSEMRLANDEIENATSASPPAVTWSEPENLYTSIVISEDPLVWEVEKQIQDLKEESTDKNDSCYKDEIAALKAAKNCLNKKIDIVQFQTILDQHKEYDKGIIFRSDTGKIIDNVLKNLALKTFRENKLAEMKNTNAFKKYDLADQSKAMQIFNENMDNINYSELDIDSLHFDKTICNQYPAFKDMEKYTRNLVNTIHPNDFYINELEIYISFIEDQLFNFQKKETIAAAKAYQEYLKNPTRQNLETLSEHEEAKEGILGKIIEQIEKADIRIVTAAPDQTRMRK